MLENLASLVANCLLRIPALRAEWSRDFSPWAFLALGAECASEDLEKSHPEL